MKEKKNDSKIANRIISLNTWSIALLVFFVALGSAVLLGSSKKNDMAEYLKLSTYTIIKETALMSAENTKSETVTDLLEGFKDDNGSDVTIFSYNEEEDTLYRKFSTVPGALNTPIDRKIWEALQTGEPYFSKKANVNGTKYYAYYEPIMKDGKCDGAIFAGRPASVVDNVIATAMLKSIMIGFGGGCIAITITMKIARRIARRLKQNEQSIKTLTTNDLTAEFPRCEKVQDEIDEISNAVANFAEQLKYTLRNNTEAAKALNEVSDELADRMNVAYNYTDKITRAIREIASGVENQTQETQDITQNVTDIGQRIDDISKRMSKLSDNTKIMLNILSMTSEGVHMAEQTNANVLGSVREVNGQINTTSKSVDEIRSFVDIIKEISSQTNLLSLNASIEAAHAGDQGKGFAVVAEEIRKLAEQSSSSAAKIESTIENLLEDYKLIVDKMIVTTESIEEQNDSIIRTKGAFTNLQDNIQRLADQVGAVTDTVEEVDNIKNTIIDAICSLSAVSEENSAATEEITSSVEELNTVISKATDGAKEVKGRAKELMDDVSVFKV